MNTPHRRKEWLEFKDWCGQRRLRAFPAHPWTLSAYILWLDSHRRYRTLHKRLDVIARVHIRACVHSPENDELVRRTLEAVEKRRQSGSHKSFTGEELLAPPVRKDTVEANRARRGLRRSPPLVSRRPQPNA